MKSITYGGVTFPCSRAGVKPLRKVLDQRQNQLAVTGVHRSGLDHERHAVGVNEQRVFRSSFPAIHRARSGRITAIESPHKNAVDHRQFSLEDGRLAKDREDVEMQSLPDTTGVQPPKAAVSHSY